MNKSMNLPAIQRIMMEFEKQNSMKDMKKEMMADAVDDAMEDDEEDEEAEGDKILQAVLEESTSSRRSESPLIASGLKADNHTAQRRAYWYPLRCRAGCQQRQAVAVGGGDTTAAGDGGVSLADEEALQARLDKLRGP